MSRGPSEALTPRPRLYVVALSHLDTQWRWTVRDTARAFLPATVLANEKLIAAFPAYVLSFEGAHRYRLLADCHPELAERVRRQVEAGRWFPAGAAWEAFDANLPSPESIVRQILLGRLELERVVGRSSDDLFLPDCFGFPRSLPTVAAHCGIVGFTTQKLRRGEEMRAAFGIPFPLGRWIGPDGGVLLAALDPGEYGAQTREDLSRSESWLRRLQAQREAGLPVLLPTLQGLGDRGGAIAPQTAAWLERAVDSEGPIEVVVAPSERIFRDLAPDDVARLPSHDGDLLLRLHATGCYTSRSQLKRWHRRAEDLGAAAERAAALARPYAGSSAAAARRDALRRSWELVLAHQMHDDLTGTSIPAAYRYSAAGLACALNGFAEELEGAVESVARALDTATEGEPLIVFNPSSFPRRDLVEVEGTRRGEAVPPRVVGPDGGEAPSQWRRTEGGWRGCFLADVPAFSFSVFELRDGGNAGIGGEPGVEQILESSRHRVRVDARGDLASWFEIAGARDFLSAPSGIELLANRSDRFPSWEIPFDVVTRPPFDRLSGPARFEWLETGPLRRTLRVRQRCAGSDWRRDWSVATAGDGEEIVELRIAVDWRTDAALAKASFDFAWEFPEALYDLGVGVAPRGVSTPELYEVPAQSWAAAPHPGGGGAAVLSDVRQGWDHPAPHRLRLSLLHTPAIGRRFRYQRRQDFGAHEMRIGLASYRADQGLDHLARLGERFRQPLLGFHVSRGGAGATRVWAPLAIDEPGVLAMALKPKEIGDALVLRLREARGAASSARLSLAPGFSIRRELDGGERATAESDAGRPLGPFALRTLEIAVDSPPSGESTGASLELPRDTRAVRDLGEPSDDGGLDGRGAALPRHLLPPRIFAGGLALDLAPLLAAGTASAVACAGQRIELPRGARRVALLVGAFRGAIETSLLCGSTRLALAVPDSFADPGRFDELPLATRLFVSRRVRPGRLERRPIRLRIPHRLDRHGRIDPCRAVLLYGFELEVALAAGVLELPRAHGLLLFAATADERPPARATPSAPLFTF